MIPGATTSIDSPYLRPNQGNQRLLNNGGGSLMDPNRRYGQMTSPPQGETGIIEILSLSDAQANFVRGDGSIYAPRYQGITNGVTGYVTGISIPLLGINSGGSGGMSSEDLEKSHLAWLPDGSGIVVSAPKEKMLWALQVLDNGMFVGNPMRIDVRGAATRIATGSSPYGELVAVVERNKLSMLKANRFDALYGTSVLTLVRQSIPSNGRERFVDAAFSPSGRKLFIATMPSAGLSSTVGGRVLVCDVGTMLEETEGPMQSFVERMDTRGCRDPETYGGYGTQQVHGIPIRLSVTSQLAAFLSPQGPQIFRVDIDDIDPTLAEEILGAGPIRTRNYSPTSLDSRRGPGSAIFTDMVIHPRSQNILALERDRITTFSADNYFALGRTDESAEYPGANLSCLAMDPGRLDDPTDADLMLAGDRNGFVWMHRLDGRSFTPASEGDKAFMQGSVVDLAIRTKSQLRNTLAGSPPAQTAETQQ